MGRNIPIGRRARWLGVFLITAAGVIDVNDPNAVIVAWGPC
jgi:hypothetical protein